MIKAASDLKTEWLPKALLLMDPWPFPLLRGIEDGSVRLRCATQLLNTESYHKQKKNPFDSWAAIK